MAIIYRNETLYMSNRKVTKTNRVRRESTKMEVYKDKVEKRPRQKSVEDVKLLINPEDTPSNPLTHQRLMEWLADTGWVYGYVRKRISPMSGFLYEDFAQSVWLEILQVKPEKIMQVWYTGKGAFVNFIKKIVDIQIKSTTSTNYRTNQRFHNTHCLLTDDEWREFEEGRTDSSFVDSYPVKCQCPSGNRKKMITVEHDIQPIHVEHGFNLTDEQ